MMETPIPHQMDPEQRRLFEQEYLIVWATERLSIMMEEKGLSKADLARLLGTSRAYVTNLLSGRTNLTLRTLADVAASMGYRIQVQYEPLRYGKYVTARARHEPRRITSSWTASDTSEPSAVTAQPVELAA